jgi:hypothetical protein
MGLDDSSSYPPSLDKLAQRLKRSTLINRKERECCLAIWTAGFPRRCRRSSWLRSTATCGWTRRPSRAGWGQLGPAADAAPLPRLAQVAELAAFLASNQAAAITGTFVNVTSGTLPSWQVNSVQDVVAAASSLDPGPGLGAGRAAVGVGW